MLRIFVSKRQEITGEFFTHSII